MTSSGSVTGAFPAGERRSGKQNVQRWLRELWIYDEVSIDIEEIIDLDDSALGITQFHGVLRAPRLWPGPGATSSRSGTD